MRILVVEDDDGIAATIRSALELAGFLVEREANGENGWFRGDSEAFDAIILDLGLPVLDGLTVLKRWRKAGVATPIMILTARGNWDERVEGIDAGADDYLAKPFRVEELVARTRALLRRAAGHPSPIIELGEISLDTRQVRVAKSGLPVPLSPQEYRLVSYLMHHRGRVVGQPELTEHLYLQDTELDSNAIEVLVRRVRQKLGTDAIVTRRGFGYGMGLGPE
ncbi:MAG: response regulator transcription factor [Devosia sp.]|uniref:response regulator transcription factor n=1 Tax=Devosia sp. TaxID=1871048 RepID=UPI001AD02CCA|nr:response regulator transcription factor [Devosia sp.]MBN9310150.1 response regulator transcription factor [Devosia sp.]MBN9314589.1 response regulator transcription factor [Devosia sp.]